jgi:hypothetical protein
MAELVYALCGAVSVLCAALLWRSYRRAPARLLLWSGMCFIGLAINNVLLVVDLSLWASVDLQPLRSGVALVAILVMIVGCMEELR